MTDRFNTAMAQIQLLETEPVFDAAVTVDKALVQLTGEALSAQFGRERSRSTREPLTLVVQRYLDVSRVALGSSQLGAGALARAAPLPAEADAKQEDGR